MSFFTTCILAQCTISAYTPRRRTYTQFAATNDQKKSAWGSSRKLELHVAVSLAHDVHRGGGAALNLQQFTNHLHFSKCNRMHPSDSGCSLHTGVCRLQQPTCRLQKPAYERHAACFSMLHASCIRAYEGCVRSYCSLHAGTHAACMQPACLPSVNPALVHSFVTGIVHIQMSYLYHLCTTQRRCLRC